MIWDFCFGKPTLKHQSPKGSGRWKNVKSVDSVDEADYVVILNGIIEKYPFLKDFDRDRIILFSYEPREYGMSYDFQNQDVPHKFVDIFQPATWEFTNTYDELKYSKFPKKNKKLSFITTNHGDIGYFFVDEAHKPLFEETIHRHTVITNPDFSKSFTVGKPLTFPQVAFLGGIGGTQILSGHALRMQFLRKLINKYPGQIDLFGRGLEHEYNYSPCWKGIIYDKWDGLANYRYSICIDNTWQDDLWTARVGDAALAGCMPIFWGCPNLEKYFPKNSFMRFDVTKEDAPDVVMEMAKSDFREQNLDALEEAKRLVLDVYNVWPVVHKYVNMVDNDRRKVHDE